MIDKEKIRLYKATLPGLWMVVVITLLCFGAANAQKPVVPNAETAKPWVFWYWMQAGVSREGITADLEAMKANGLGGAYLMPIKGAGTPPVYTPASEQLTPQWWAHVRHAVAEADRLGLKLGMHVSDGFALAGGPWITPEKSMQKVVWTKTFAAGGKPFNDVLPQPETKESYYRDIAVFAFPTPEGSTVSTLTAIPVITTSTGTDASFLATGKGDQTFRSDDACWIQYAFATPFTLRSVNVITPGNNYQAHRLRLDVSDDGKTFRPAAQLTAPRHGWQDTDANVTHSIPAVTARFFRFRYDKTGSEPGAEDLDAAKWKPVLKLRGLVLSSAATLHQYEGKSGAIWRVSTRSTAKDIPNALCVPRTQIIDLTDKLDASGRLTWQAPAGHWTILRMGHTSTGHTNATGGAGKGLECDKFDPEAVTLQYNQWFGEAVRQVGPTLAPRVLSMFHVDSWECGSQNWSRNFRDEFRKRRGYDLYSYLPAMAGIPVDDAETSERFLYDIRQTIADVVRDNFYITLAGLAHKAGMTFSAESIAPTMMSDGMLHYSVADLPMGEFWLNSPTHDKPNDMADAISGAHVYGKPIVQAEAFTTVRMTWDEHPGMLKTLGDRNYTLGVNRLVYHVFTHNPWLDRKPGMTLDGVGLYFQRDQTWWKPGRAWVEYATRCQTLLQQGVPVVDVAVFTGEELPRRAMLPDRLVSSMPGIFGDAVVTREKERLKNTGEPLRAIPDGVTHSANMADPERWIDPLRGYAFDSFNKDALQQATVQNGRIVLPGGASYGVLLLPGNHPMSPDASLMSGKVAEKLLALVQAGATIIVTVAPKHEPGLEAGPNTQPLFEQLSGGSFTTSADGMLIKTLGKGRIVTGPYTASSFASLGLTRDFTAVSKKKVRSEIAWTHRRAGNKDIYFISNQSPVDQSLDVSLRETGRVPELYDAVTGETRVAAGWKIENGHTTFTTAIPANGSLFIILEKPAGKGKHQTGKSVSAEPVQTIAGPWFVRFDSTYGGPADSVTFAELTDWSTHTQPGIRYYSGTATYHTEFIWDGKNAPQMAIDLGDVANIAEVTINGKRCGIAWTSPHRVDITKALKRGVNTLDIAVTNTWHNRLIGDHALPEAERITRTTAPYRLDNKPLARAGLLGPVVLLRITER